MRDHVALGPTKLVEMPLHVGGVQHLLRREPLLGRGVQHPVDHVRQRRAILVTVKVPCVRAEQFPSHIQDSKPVNILFEQEVWAHSTRSKDRIDSLLRLD